MGRAVKIGAVVFLVVFLPRVAFPDVRPSQIRAVYVVPGDHEVDGTMKSAVRNEIEVLQEWFAAETGGRTLDFAEEDGVLVVDVVQLTHSEMDIQTNPDPWALVGRELPWGDDDLVLAYVPVKLWDHRYCGQGSAVGLAIVWGGCTGGPLLTSTRMGHGATWVTAHELVHALGGVGSCAPNYDGEGHVNDREDVLAGAYAMDFLFTTELHLDPGRDDYYDTDGDCGDIADHPAWK